MASSTILETTQRRRSHGDLPISSADCGGGGKAGGHLIGLRRRMSSFSVRIQPLSSATAEWLAFGRAHSMPSAKAGGAARALRRWWNRGVGWVMARRPTFAHDLEMDGEEACAGAGAAPLRRGTWRHVFYKIRAGIRQLLGRDGLPVSSQDFRYDSVSYAQNFDDGGRREP